MQIIVLGAGLIGVSCAWHLRQYGHDVVVVERQAQAALETSFANAGQISVSYCEPWANAQAPVKVLKWLGHAEAPLLFRPRWPWGRGLDQWLWGLKFLRECNDAAFERNLRQLVALGKYSHEALKHIVQQTGIEYHRLQRGIAHFYTNPQAFEQACTDATLMQRHGVQRRVVSREELLSIEPALQAYASQIAGGTYTDSDESGDARVFTQALAAHAQKAGVQFLYQHDIHALTRAHTGQQTSSASQAGSGGGVGVWVKDLSQAHASATWLAADAVVVACGSHTAGLLRQVGVHLPIYPGKGYSATLKILHPEAAPWVSMIDDSRKIAITRLGDQLRVAGTIEVGGFDLDLHTTIARARCEMLTRRVEELFPGVCDTRLPAQGGHPNFWCGLRPATPTNIPYIGRTHVPGIWVNAGHGTLGWTHAAGSGLALAELMSGQRPRIADTFRFLNTQRSHPG